VPVPALGEPALSAHDALALAGRPDLPPEAHARLVVWAPPGRATRLAYLVRLPADLTRLDAPELTIDAHSGELLWRQNGVRFSDGMVFDNNPSTSALGLVALALAAGAQRLADHDFQVLSCVDRMSCPIYAGTRQLRWCEAEALAAADTAGDFLYDRPGSDAAVDDAFAEVQMYHHASRAMAYFRSLGAGDLGTRPMQAIVNLRVPASGRVTCDGASSSAPLTSFENAAFVPRGAFVDVWPATDSLVFGQGARIDYAYDGDVIAHELSHALMAGATPLGLLALDARGLDGSMWAMHEGFADYFAAALMDDPHIAEYVGEELLGSGHALRVIDNRSRCPQDLAGEEHDDSEIFSGALWEMRSTIHESRHATLDRAMWTVIDSLGPFETFASVAGRLADEAAVRLDSASAARVRAVVEERGLTGCDERVEDRPLGIPKRRMYLRGAADFALAGLLPGPMQLRIHVERASSEIRVYADNAWPQGGVAAELVVLVKPEAPIRWDPDTLEHDAEVVGAMVGERGGRLTASVPGTYPPGVYHVQLANAGRGVLLEGVRVVAPRIGGDGCAVAGGGAPAPGAIVLLLLFLLFVRFVPRGLTRGARRARRAAR
jgi:hypothetical protein